jgi:metallo-beta-lactamase class B
MTGADTLHMMRKLLFTLLLANAALAQKDPVSRSWNQPVEPFRIAGNLHYVGASDIASYLITTPKGHIVIDGGFEETAPMILENIRKLGFRVEDVRILLNTHAHYDHAGGLAELKRVTGATFYAMWGEIPQLARGGLDDPQFGDRFPFPPIEADRFLEDGDHVTLGGTTLTAHHTPGHTRGCTTWTMRVRDGEHMRNVVILGSPTAPSEYRLTDNPRYPNAVWDYRRQFERLKALPCDIFLASHGNFFGLDKIVAGEKKIAGGDEYHKFVTAIERRFEERVAGEGK